MDTRKLLLTAADIAALPGETKTHHLNPNAIRFNKSLGDAVGLSHLGVHLVYVEPGHSVTEDHSPYYKEECIYVLSGTGTTSIGGNNHRLSAGDFICLGRNSTAHTIINDGAETLVCLVVGQRLERRPSDFLRKKKRPYSPHLVLS